MSDSTKYLLVGGGVASVWAAMNIRERDKEGRVIIICDEQHPPYDKPPLSKQYIAKDGVATDDAYSKFDNFYPDNNIELMKGIPAASIDRKNRTVSLANGTAIQYEKLLLATGSSPRKLNVQGGNLGGIHYLRTIEQAQAIHDEAAEGKRAVFVGAGYLNMEAASGCLLRGVDVTIIELGDRPWGRLASSTLGGFLTNYYDSNGAMMLFGEEVSGFEGSGRVSAVATRSGEKLPADFVVVAIGAALRTDLAEGAGLEMGSRGGVLVDETLQTSDPNIWAAGDIACFQDVALGRQWHAEHHLNAKWQGRVVGATLAGEHKVYDQVPYFYSDFLDLHMILRGDPAGSAEAKTTVLGDLNGAEFIELYGNSEGKLRMGVAISREEPKLDPISDKLEELIRAGASVVDLSLDSFAK